MLPSKIQAVAVVILITLLCGCASTLEPKKETTAVEKGPSTVAVWDFDNLSPSSFAQPDLGERLASETTEVIMRKGNYQVVERQNLLLALEELNIGTQSFVDESTRLRLGKMVGARMMVFGAYQSFGGQQTRIDIRLVEVETGRTRKSVDKLVPSSNYQAWFEAVRQAADELTP
jgi:curli biogenesis system outer membrane secretion channel CsgG